MNVDDLDWVGAAACADPTAGTPRQRARIFHPPGVPFEQAPNPALFALGKTICAACPVRQRCLDYALANNETDGLWGGMDPEERRREKRRKGRETKPSMQPHPCPHCGKTLSCRSALATHLRRIHAA